jgi:hypothetical protein
MTKHGKMREGKSKRPQVMPGFDYGLDRPTTIMTPPVFEEEMRRANIIACAYGQMSAPGVGSVVPCISMVARHPEPLTKAFKQFHAWIEATGPDALKVEILYSRDGYYIAFGPEYRHAMWRTVGVDQFISPTFFGVTYIKTIDSRNSFLDDLAQYAKSPVAPIKLLGACFTGSHPNGPAPNPSEIQPVSDCPELLLFNLPVYKTKAEVPEFSGLRIMAAGPTNEGQVKSYKEFEQRTMGPEDANRSRERRLAALMPVTIHMLRTYPPLQEKLKALQKRGVARWQIEQAVVNQRLWSQVMPEQRARLKNANDLYRAIEQFAELDTPTWDVIADDQEAIFGQIFRDARVLLKKIGTSAPDTLEDCQKQLTARGYLQIKSAA